MWSLCVMILIELSLGFLSGDHTFAYSFNEVVSLGIIIVRSWWKVGCPHGADQFGIDLCRGHGFLYFETNRRGRGSGHASSPIWPGSIYISIGLVKFMQNMMCRTVNAGTSLQIVMHGQLQPTFLQRSFVGLCVQAGRWAGAECSQCQSHPELWMLSSCRRLMFDAVPYTMQP